MSQLDYRYSQFPVTFLYIAQKPAIVAGFFMVGLFGFEPKTSSMSTKRSNQLSYNPMSDECIIHDMRETCKMLFAISCIWLDRCGISTLQLAILLWIAVSPNDAADPIGFIYRIRSSPCRKMTGASFPAGRAYGGQDTDLLQIHLSGLPKSNKGKRPLLCTHPKLFVHGNPSEIRTHYTSEYPALQDPARAGYSYHCSLVGLSGFEPETSSM